LYAKAEICWGVPDHESVFETVEPGVSTDMAVTVLPIGVADAETAAKASILAIERSFMGM
jgi:hypothetical protein